MTELVIWAQEKGVFPAAQGVIRGPAVPDKADKLLCDKPACFIMMWPCVMSHSPPQLRLKQQAVFFKKKLLRYLSDLILNPNFLMIRKQMQTFNSNTFLQFSFVGEVLMENQVSMVTRIYRHTHTDWFMSTFICGIKNVLLVRAEGDMMWYD